MSEERAQWPPGSRGRTVDLDGPVHVTEYGDPDALDTAVCLHGLGGSALNFGLVGPLLATGRRVLVPDLLGHGRSHAPGPREGAVEAQLRMLDRLLVTQTRRPVTLVGHSMGGTLALLFSLREAGRVGQLVLLDPPVPNITRFRRDPRLTAKLLLLRQPWVAALVVRQIVGMTPEQLVAKQLADATPHVERIPAVVAETTVAEVRATRAGGDDRAAQLAQFRAIVDVVSLLAQPALWRRRLAQVTPPTLWLQGADDPLARIEPARVLAATRPDWTFLTRTGVGHLPHLEDPTWTAETIAQWLDDRTG
jgi:pimeloyl-ACP methyl ester carboxylesterase